LYRRRLPGGHLVRRSRRSQAGQGDRRAPDRRPPGRGSGVRGGGAGSMRRWLTWLLVGGIVLRMFGPRIHPRFKPPQEHPLRIPGRTVFVGDDEFLVREMGGGDDLPILLVHGLAGSSLTEWYQVAPKLA